MHKQKQKTSNNQFRSWSNYFVKKKKEEQNHWCTNKSKLNDEKGSVWELISTHVRTFGSQWQEGHRRKWRWTQRDRSEMRFGWGIHESGKWQWQQKMKMMEPLFVVNYLVAQRETETENKLKQKLEHNNGGVSWCSVHK